MAKRYDVALVEEFYDEYKDEFFMEYYEFDSAYDNLEEAMEHASEVSGRRDYVVWVIDNELGYEVAKYYNRQAM